MKTFLIIFFLSVQSSYSHDAEKPATQDAFDTVQFYSSEGKHWRIRTYAKDQDVHIHSLGSGQIDLVQVARENTEKSYGDVLTEGYIIETSDGLEGVRSELEKRGLSSHLEITPFGAVFWAPEGTQYRSKSEPRK